MQVFSIDFWKFNIISIIIWIANNIMFPSRLKDDRDWKFEGKEIIRKNTEQVKIWYILVVAIKFA